MLLGLALIAGPLLVAVVDAGLQIRSLLGHQPGAGARGRAERAPVAQPASPTSPRWSARRASTRCSATPDCSTPIARTDQSLAATRTQLALLLDDEPTRRSLEEFAAMHNEIAQRGELDAAAAARPSPRSSRASTGSTTSPNASPRAATRRSTRASRSCSGRPRARSGGCSGSPRCWPRSP